MRADGYVTLEILYPVIKYVLYEHLVFYVLGPYALQFYVMEVVGELTMLIIHNFDPFILEIF